MSTEGMTDAERATAYEIEAAHVLDRLTRRAVGMLPAGMAPTELALKLAKLIVEAAVLRMRVATAEPRPLHDDDLNVLAATGPGVPSPYG